MSRADYDRLHRRCMNQRRELRRLNRKINALTDYVRRRLGGEEYRWSLEHHRNNELSRELCNAYKQIERLARKPEAAE